MREDPELSAKKMDPSPFLLFHQDKELFLTII